MNEGNEFVLEFLGPGCVLNYRLFFTEDLQQFFVRAREHTFYFELEQEDLIDVSDDYPQFEKALLFYT